MFRKTWFLVALFTVLSGSVAAAQVVMTDSQKDLAALAAAEHRTPGVERFSAVSDAVPLRDWTIPQTGSAELTLHNGTAMATVPSQASHLVTLVPCRVVDTRNANGAYGGPKLVGGVARSFALPGGGCPGIPTTASAYSLNVTVFAPEAPGFMSLYPTGGSAPIVSNLNFNTGETVPNAAIVPGGTAGSINVFSSANAHVIIDINGYFSEGGPTDRHPLAFAHVLSTGVLVAHSANVASCTYNAVSVWYECTITGETFVYSSYITTVTPVNSTLIASTDSIGGKLIVILRNTSGTQEQGGFQWMTIKP